ncbi:hypothetical protein [Brevundimonas sp.]|uniref:hypothetical protein n=1 Tax=Brevundimonas sp. TaxID=1871086 RepID=UPI002D481607|nr:hypothetical protein [Brevundimonas sp.]HYC68868.1 hypothetical protein [Brevundimonas sp.]
MSRRTLADARQALMVRRLQQEAALHKLRAQQQRVQAAHGNLDQSIDKHLLSEEAWGASLDHIKDAGMIGLWRTHTITLRNEVRAAELGLAEETASMSDLHLVWGHQTRLAEAVQGVVRTAFRKVQRIEDERRLGAAEDARLARRTEG